MTFSYILGPNCIHAQQPKNFQFQILETHCLVIYLILPLYFQLISSRSGSQTVTDSSWLISIPLPSSKIAKCSCSLSKFPSKIGLPQPCDFVGILFFPHLWTPKCLNSISFLSVCFWGSLN